MHYQKNYLTSVICRIDLLNAGELGGTVRPAMSNAVGENLYPQVTAKPSAQVSFNVGPQGPQMVQGAAGFSYEHRRSDKLLPVLVVSQNLVTVEYGPGDYDHFPPFRAEIEKVIGALAAHHAQAAVARVGLRYINEIRLEEGNALDWATIVHQDLANAVKAAIPDGMKLARTMHQVQAFDDNATVLIHYGLPNPDYPAQAVRRNFVLDIDAFRTGPVALTEVVACITHLNKVCESAFERFIENGLREKMGIIND